MGSGQNAGNQHFLLFPQNDQHFPRRFTSGATFNYGLQLLSIWMNIIFLVK